MATLIVAIFLLVAGGAAIYGGIYVVAAGVMALLAALGLKKD